LKDSIGQRVKSAIRDVPDFPKEGIIFKDISSIFLDPALSKEIGEEFTREAAKLNPDAICAVDSRGFLFGPIIAQNLNIPLILIRKKGKLPGKTIAASYDLEYGSATIEMHVDDLPVGSKVLIHYDLLATGGTTKAAAELVQKTNSKIVGFSFLLHLGFLDGKNKLQPFSKDIYSMVEY